MNLDNIKTPQDIYNFMDKYIKYGWFDQEHKVHINDMKNVRDRYRTASLEETLKFDTGTCIEQVYLMKKLFDQINIKSKMYCARIYDGEDFNIIDNEFMHCFLLYFLDDKVYHMEIPNWEIKGIYEYASEEEAVDTINKYYINKVKGKASPVVAYDYVEPHITFKEFNKYIDSLEPIQTKNSSAK